MKENNSFHLIDHFAHWAIRSKSKEEIIIIHTGIYNLLKKDLENYIFDNIEIEDILIK